MSTKELELKLSMMKLTDYEPKDMELTEGVNSNNWFDYMYITCTKYMNWIKFSHSSNKKYWLIVLFYLYT